MAIKAKVVKTAKDEYVSRLLNKDVVNNVADFSLGVLAVHAIEGFAGFMGGRLIKKATQKTRFGQIPLLSEKIRGRADVNNQLRASGKWTIFPHKANNASVGNNNENGPSPKNGKVYKGDLDV